MALILRVGGISGGVVIQGEGCRVEMTRWRGKLLKVKDRQEGRRARGGRGEESPEQGKQGTGGGPRYQ